MESRAGLRNRQEDLKRAIALQRRRGGDMTLVPLWHDQSWPDWLQALLAQGYETFAIAGGDGTVNSIAALLLNTPYRLGVIPIGTFNHFAKHLGIPLDIDAACDVIRIGHTESVDVGEVNGTPFLNFSSFGVYADILAKRVQRQRLGWKAWSSLLLAYADLVRSYPLLELCFIEQTKPTVIRTPLVFVGNNRFMLGGFDLLRGREDFHSGVLQVAYAHHVGRWSLLRYLFATLCSRIKAEQLFVTFSPQSFEITFQQKQLSIAIDGEVRKTPSPLRYTIRPQALHVIMPRLKRHGAVAVEVGPYGAYRRPPRQYGLGKPPTAERPSASF